MKKILAASLVMATVLLAGCGNSSTKAADNAKQVKYPEKPINLIVPYEAGSSADIMIRPMAEKVSAKLGTPVAVINKAGAAGSIGGKEVFDAKPDGYTLGAYNGAVINKLQGLHQFTYKDFDTIGVYNTSPCIVVVNAKKPWKTMKELIDYLKSHPGEVKASTSSKGGYFWLSAILFENATETKLNIVPQTGAGSMVALQVAGGHTELGFLDIPTVKAQIDSGSVRLLAVLGPERLAQYSDVPTLKELGYNVDISVLRPILAPKGLPKPVYEKLVQVFGEVANDPEYKKFALKENTVPLWMPGEQGIKSFEEQEKAFRPVMEKAGLLKN